MLTLSIYNLAHLPKPKLSIKPHIIFSVATAVFLLFSINTQSQSLSNLREKTIQVSTDTIKIDTLSIVPGSLQLFFNGDSININCYYFNSAASALFFIPNNSCGIGVSERINITYRTLPINLNRIYSNKLLNDTASGFEDDYTPFFYRPESKNDDLFSLSGLSKSGSISRGISFGNNQDVVVNSSLNLQLNGKLSDDVYVLAAITDNNIPFQAEGNTQQLQEFDKVFIQLYNDNNKLIAGDFELRPSKNYFLNFYKKGQGGLYQGNFPVGKNKNQMSVSASGAISKGKYVRNAFAGEEQNQGPYQLRGAENERFIIILSGTEKVYLDGVLLKRGQENDYIIDYNTAEIIFTPNNLITKDVRLIIEFEYSDRNYSRSFLYAGTDYKNEKFEFSISTFSEQDSKNQPLEQDVDGELQNAIAAVGDNLEEAVVFNVDSIAFNSDEILYSKIDTPNSSVPIYVYSTSSDSAFFRVGFSFLGQGKGNYVAVNTNTNGRVYKWVEPINGILQGAYEPIRQLISPKKQQWINAVTKYKISESTHLEIEGSLSNNDINLYSNFDKGNDVGFALKTNIVSNSDIGIKDSSTWSYQTTVSYEFVNKQFNFIEPFRNTEFSRDWSINSSQLNADENLFGASIVFKKSEILNIGYGFKSFIAGEAYEGYMNDLFFHYTGEKYLAQSNFSYLSNKGAISESEFLRGVADVSKKIKNFSLGVGIDFENNPIRIPGKDSLLATSRAKTNYKAFLKHESGENLNYGAEYFHGINYLPVVTNLELSDVSDNFSLFIASSNKATNAFSAKLTYRELTIKDTAISNLQEENSILGKFDYSMRILSGFIRSNTYLEFGTGQELKREFSYLKVPAGTGNYSWIDYNSNGIKELSEFEIAIFSDKAEYIRVFTPTNEFTKTRTNQLNQIFNINPKAIIKSADKHMFIAKFSAQSAVRYTNKLVDEDILTSLNPFISIKDSNLVSTAASIRNSLFFNKNHSKYSADITNQLLNNKAFLTSGFDFRKQNINTANIRWNFTKFLSLNLELEKKELVNQSDFSANRNFTIQSNKIKPLVSYQSGSSFRLSMSYSYTIKKGDTDEGNDTKANIHDVGTEIRYSSIKQGILSTRFNYIQNDFSGNVNSPTGYEVLQGLNKGVNYLWNASVQKNISNSMQLSLNYDGRKSTDAKTVHTGSMQVRAFF